MNKEEQLKTNQEIAEHLREIKRLRNLVTPKFEPIVCVDCGTPLKQQGYVRFIAKMDHRDAKTDFRCRKCYLKDHIDSSLKAPKAKSVDEWLSAPNRFDLSNVDTNKP